jgi:hypothetical protein
VGRSRRHLSRAAEAVRNDITEAREFPEQILGIDLMSFGHWPHDRMADRGELIGLMQQL